MLLRQNINLKNKNNKKENKKDDHLVVFFVEKKHRKVPQATQKQMANGYGFYARTTFLPVDALAVKISRKSSSNKLVLLDETRSIHRYYPFCAPGPEHPDICIYILHFRSTFYKMDNYSFFMAVSPFLKFFLSYDFLGYYILCPVY